MKNARSDMAHRLIFCMVMLIISSGSSAFAQKTISDEAARVAYADCRILFEENKFVQCYSACQSLAEQMGRKTRKVQWLLVESGYTAFSYAIDRAFKKQLDTASAALLSYKNLSELHAEIRQLEAIMDTSEYRYSYVRDIGSEVLAKANEHIYQKDRTPEKAVAFLNECAKKFPKTAESRGVNFDIQFKLNGSVLNINAAAATFSKYYKTPYYKGEMNIDLNGVWIEQRYVTRMKSEMELVYIFSDPNPSGSGYQSDTLPVLYDGSTASDAFFKISWRRSSGKTDKIAKQELEDASFRILYAPYIISIYHFFNEAMPEFSREQYDRKIEETFRYLINYFKK
jgi:hypothetical protein